MAAGTATIPVGGSGPGGGLNQAGTAGSDSQGGMAGVGTCSGRCSESCKCQSSEGPCTTSNDCAASLVCGSNAGPKFGVRGNVCVPAHCVNDIVDADETSRDCGGSCGCALFESLGDMAAHPHAVNADGSIAVGEAIDSNGTYRAILWTRTGMRWLSDLESAANGIDASGSTIAGHVRQNGDLVPVVWRATDNYVTTSLNWPWADRRFISISGISANGTVIVGSNLTPTGGSEGFRWTQGTGFVSLEGIQPGKYVDVLAVSGSGVVVVGKGADASGALVPFRWQNGASASLGAIGQGGSGSGEARATNIDGSVIVGQAPSPLGFQAFRWMDGQMIGLGDLSGGSYSSIAYGVSDNGRRVVGMSSGMNSNAIAADMAFLWDDDAPGMQQLLDAMRVRGFEELPLGWIMQKAVAISADGKVIVGEGPGPSARISQGWRVTLEP